MYFSSTCTTKQALGGSVQMYLEGTDHSAEYWFQSVTNNIGNIGIPQILCQVSTTNAHTRENYRISLSKPSELLQT